MKKILLFSPLCKPKDVLEVTLPSYLNLESEGFTYDILLYNDNNIEDSKKYTDNFISQHDNVSLLPNIFNENSAYQKHNWNISLIDRISAIKNKAIEYALKNNYDYIFLVDADLVLNPNTLMSLVNAQKHFIFEIFWTMFTNAHYYKPNAWDYHSWVYDSPESIIKLKEPGVYEVGAGGACTLVSRELLERGLNFNRLSNMRFPGEDRHFCTRVQALNEKVYIDTHFPAFHIHNPRLVDQAKLWYSNGAKPEFFKSWLTAIWENQVRKNFEEPKTKLARIKKGLYFARRAYINYFDKL
ncbi:glycosyltransferase [Psychroflexus planctonicus]|uniref:Glycosyl transferase family 2 n=1 Tax=Psychroflexus planctonicus TaxID=1526575 RepID=A0ABQ1SEE0_9FLAO|nr:hypothetical protein [Psychroflexus planctonicus]GGE32341.1 hypothetical protein GCM10010832_10770 [Psychroflexus planctonicus]